MTGNAVRIAIVALWAVLLAIHLGAGSAAGRVTSAGNAIAAQAGRSARYEAVWRGATVAVLVQEVDGSDGSIAVRQRIELTGPLPMLPVEGPLGEVTLVQVLDHGLRLTGLRLSGRLLGEPISGTAAIDHRGLHGSGGWGAHRIVLADPALRPESLAGCGMVAALPPGLAAGQRIEMPILVPTMAPTGLGLERRTTVIDIRSASAGRLTAVSGGEAASEMECLADGTLVRQRWPAAGLEMVLVRLTADDGTRIAVEP
jgi:hypothetical protein